MTSVYSFEKVMEEPQRNRLPIKGNFRPKTQFLDLLTFFFRNNAFRIVKICANSCEIFLILKGGLLSFPPPSFHVSANDVLIKQIAYSTKEAACNSLI